MKQPSLNRRDFLRGAAFGVGALVVAPTGVGLPASASAAVPATATLALVPFVDWYRTNVTANLTAETNAAVRVLSGVSELWQTGAEWNTGVVLAPKVMRENVQYVVDATRRRTADQAKQAFISDRRHQSYSLIAGLGPLADAYRTGARAVTSIVTAPDGTPPTKIDDAVPAGAPAGSAIGAGSATSELGEIVQLVNTVRGSFSSSNPSKFAFQYPRPWRLTDDSTVVDTGLVDELGFPVYQSGVVVAPQLLRQRSADPASDGGFPSGHANAAWLAALAYAYAVPERFSELLAAAAELGDSRIIAGMHSPVDVIGGRILATALAAAILADPANAGLKSGARARAVEYFTSVTGTSDLYTAAHTGADQYGDRAANRELVTTSLTYTLRRQGGHSADLEVPKGAEVLLETRFPYLSPAQVRDVLRTTALPSGYPLLDGPEQWGRLNLFAAADGYARFDRSVTVELDTARGGLAADDTWRNDIAGAGGLVKTGTGTLTLAGCNSYRGGTVVRGGTLVAGSADSLGRGALTLEPGTTLRSSLTTTVEVKGAVAIAPGTTLELTGDGRRGGRYTVLRAGGVTGELAQVLVDGRPAQASYRGNSVTVEL
ncbi:phosphatase PAP2 family protein [Antribacter sp. KLBMP9083]|uniref:Phosphatase PAP2 family protein n=1 Tax=Antribacter soli TaxID=2910976 RepID=A0AA41QEK4_9MICO|nr:phosphatase PAP2 family protein [Antribacter soli]MCF4121370.1 phosphatase PAP2 family protein [Antribacter soli]